MPNSRNASASSPTHARASHWLYGWRYAASSSGRTLSGTPYGSPVGMP